MGENVEFHHLLLSNLTIVGPYIKPSVDNCPRLHVGQLSTLGLDIGPI